MPTEGNPGPLADLEKKAAPEGKLQFVDFLKGPPWVVLDASLFRGTDEEVELVRRASDVIGADRVAQWMQTSIPSLGGRTPYSLMSSKEGRSQVETVLGRIEHGVY